MVPTLQPPPAAVSPHTPFLNQLIHKSAAGSRTAVRALFVRPRLKVLSPRPRRNGASSPDNGREPRNEMGGKTKCPFYL